MPERRLEATVMGQRVISSSGGVVCDGDDDQQNALMVMITPDASVMIAIGA